MTSATPPTENESVLSFEEASSNYWRVWEENYQAAVQKSDSLLYSGLVESAFEKSRKLRNITKKDRFSALVADDKGNVLWAKNMHKPQIPASLTKNMTLYSVLEDIDQGNLKWDEGVTISRAAEKGGSLNKNKSNWRFDWDRPDEGDVVSVKDLVVMMMALSDNTVPLGLSEHNGSKANFIEKMNQKAKELGMNQTIYVDPTGLSKENRSSAWGEYLLSSALVKNFPHHHDKMYIPQYFAEEYYRRYRDSIDNRGIKLADQQTIHLKTAYLRKTKWNFVQSKKLPKENITIGIYDVFKETVEDVYTVVVFGDDKGRPITKILLDNLESLVDHDRFDDPSIKPVKPYIAEDSNHLKW